MPHKIIGDTPPRTNKRAPRALPFCGSTCTCGTPHPLRTCRTCSPSNPHPPPPFAEPAAPCHTHGGMGRGTPGPAAERRRRPSAAWWRTRWRRPTKRTLPHGVTWRAVRRVFLNETPLLAVRALNGAGAPTLLPAMHRIVNAVRPGLISPEAALYGHWMEWRESNRSGRPLSMGDTLRLTGAGSAMSLRSSAPALLHALRTRYPGNAAPYLNQARATYPGGVSELDAALHLLEVGEVTVFVEGADEASTRPPPTNPV